MQFSSALKRTMYDLKNSFFPNFLLICRAKYIFSRDMFFKRNFELIFHSVNVVWNWMKFWDQNLTTQKFQKSIFVNNKIFSFLQCWKMEMNVLALKRYQLTKYFLSTMLTKVKHVISHAADQFYIIAVEEVPIPFILQVIDSFKI